MFDFAWSELAMIGALSVLLLGPKQLPETMRSLAKIVRKLRGLSAEFQGHFNEMVREAELEELRAQVQKLSSSSIQAEVTKLVDPSGEISNALQLDPAAAEPQVAEAASADVALLVPDPAAPAPAASPAAPSPTVETTPAATPATPAAVSPAPPAAPTPPPAGAA